MSNLEHNMKVQRGILFLNLSTRWGWVFKPHPGHFTAGKEVRYTDLYGCGKSHLHRVSIPGHYSTKSVTLHVVSFRYDIYFLFLSNTGHLKLKWRGNFGPQSVKKQRSRKSFILRISSHIIVIHLLLNRINVLGDYSARSTHRTDNFLQIFGWNISRERQLWLRKGT